MTTNRGKITALVGAQYGSEGKGTIVAHIANQYNVHVRIGSPNAGHTFYWKGEKHVQRSIPCGWINPNALIFIGRGALIDMECMLEEIAIIEKYYPDFKRRLHIDANAGILSKEFQQEEGGILGEMHHRIGSTGEGVGPARIARIRRDPNQFKLFYEVAEQHGLESCVTPNTPEVLHTLNLAGFNIMIEGTQGSALSLLHSYWPYCTSTDTNAAQMLADIGIAPSMLTDVILVARTFPIRVAGNSGPMQNEITWEELSARLGRDVSERTTVTKKVRRIGEWDRNLFNMAVLLNQPTQIALTFADYIDPTLYGVNNKERLLDSHPLMEFIVSSGLSQVYNKLRYIATGPKTVINMTGE